MGAREDLLWRAGEAGSDVELEVAYLRMSPLLRKDTAVGTREAVTPEQRKISLWVSPRRVPAEFF